jgi:hypothetical protein
MTPREAQRVEVLANYEVFEAELPVLEKTHRGKYAAYRHRQLVAVFDSFDGADQYCSNRFDDRLFSIQEIVSEPLDIRWFKYAPDDNPV